MFAIKVTRLGRMNLVHFCGMLRSRGSMPPMRVHHDPAEPGRLRSRHEELRCHEADHDRHDPAHERGLHDDVHVLGRREHVVVPSAQARARRTRSTRTPESGLAFGVCQSLRFRCRPVSCLSRVYARSFHPAANQGLGDLGRADLPHVDPGPLRIEPRPVPVASRLGSTLQIE